MSGYLGMDELLVSPLHMLVGLNVCHEQLKMPQYVQLGPIQFCIYIQLGHIKLRPDIVVGLH